MSDDLLRKLRMLEEDYPGQPLVARQADLREINSLRSLLDMPVVDAQLKEIGVAAVVTETRPEPEVVPDHTEGRAIYQAYLRKVEELEVHRAYADRVVKATAGRGLTPVRHLATMGTGGGPLRCDHCGKPIVLEGGPFHGMAADAAWEKRPADNWTSWILGGMVVEVQVNGTLRIYHGYPGRDSNACCNVASWEDRVARAKFDSGPRNEKLGTILAFLEYEFPDATRDERLGLLNKILDTLYSYDPGIGVNRPGGEG